MKKILIFSCLLFHYILSGQVIVPIPADSTSQWKILRGYRLGSCYDMYNSTYYVDGTAIHNGKEFFKIYETGNFYQSVVWPPGPCNQTFNYSGRYRGMIRTENGKTYKWNGSEELLLMDFTLNVGDTHNSVLSGGLRIGSIDSVLVGSEYRKRFNFSNGDICNWMIEGVGHETGLFEPMEQAMDFVSEFICYGENNIPLLGDSNCILNVGYEDIPVQIDQIKVHPNPTSGKFKIDLKEFKKEIESYLITDICGNTILKNNVESFNTNSFDINLENCKPAVYLLIINLKNKKSIYKKIIKI